MLREGVPWGLEQEKATSLYLFYPPKPLAGQEGDRVRPVPETRGQEMRCDGRDAHGDLGQEEKSFALGDRPRPPLTPWRASDTHSPPAAQFLTQSVSLTTACGEGSKAVPSPCPLPGPRSPVSWEWGPQGGPGAPREERSLRAHSTAESQGPPK